MKKYNGFTLIELMIVMAIVGILVAVSLPSMRTYISNSSANRLSSTFLIDIMYARNHAIGNDVAVIMEPLGADPDPDNADFADTGASTFTPNATGVNWALGWRIFEVDGDANTANDIVIRTQGSFGPEAHISSGPGGHITTGPVNVLDRDTPIGFNADGRAMRSGVVSIATFGCAGDNARVIQINQIGQVLGNDIICPLVFTNQ
jgi:prepilin-type N-terminal cleavage/methylation domain-containing protein